MTIGAQVANEGWVTGSVVPQDMVPQLASFLGRFGEGLSDLAPEDWLVVISQTCDLVAYKLESEPYVELLRCKPLSGRTRAQYRDLRSTRILDFRANVEVLDDLALTAHATIDRFYVPRSIFADYRPDSSKTLDAVAIAKILNWIALRSLRPAWPDAFVKRLSGQIDKLTEILEPLKDDIAEVRIALQEQDEELTDETPYSVTLYFIVDEQVWNESSEGRKTVSSAFAKFVQVLSSCHGIEIDSEGGVLSGADFSWQLMQLTDKWNFANVSERGST